MLATYLTILLLAGTLIALAFSPWRARSKRTAPLEPTLAGNVEDDPSAAPWLLEHFSREMRRLQSDLDQGLISPASYAETEGELAKRFHVEHQQRRGQSLGKSTSPPWGLMVGLGLASVLLYTLLGRPDQPGQPFANTLHVLETKARTDPANLSNDEVEILLSARARREPADPRPHFFLGELYSAAGRDEDAARAFQAALARDPENGVAMIRLAGLLIRLDGGVVSPEIERALQTAQKRAPDDPMAGVFLGLAARQRGDALLAEQLWAESLAKVPDSNTPERAKITTMIAAFRQMNLPPADDPAPRPAP